MNCEEFVRKMDAVFYGEVDEKEESEFVNHLKECDRCRELWKDYLKVKMIIEVTKAAEKRKKRLIAVISSLIASAVIVVSLILGFKTDQTSPTQIARSTGQTHSIIPAADDIFSVSDENFPVELIKNQNRKIDILEL